MFAATPNRERSIDLPAPFAPLVAAVVVSGMAIVARSVIVTAVPGPTLTLIRISPITSSVRDMAAIAAQPTADGGGTGIATSGLMPGIGEESAHRLIENIPPRIEPDLNRKHPPASPNSAQNLYKALVL